MNHKTDASSSHHKNGDETINDNDVSYICMNDEEYDEMTTLKPKFNYYTNLEDAGDDKDK